MGFKEEPIVVVWRRKENIRFSGRPSKTEELMLRDMCVCARCTTVAYFNKNREIQIIMRYKMLLIAYPDVMPLFIV